MDPRVLALVGIAPWIAIALVVTFWPTLYALLRKRPARAAAYFVVSLIGLSISVYVVPWWEVRNPDGDWEFESPGILYYGLSWPVTTAAAWAVAAISDVGLALAAVEETHD